METRELFTAFVALAIVAFHNADCEDKCQDQLTNCNDFNKSTCEAFPGWAEANCAKTCGSCADLACPKGWTHYKADNTCLKVFGNENDETKKRLDWGQARVECRKLDATLVQIRDQDKNAFVLELLGDSKWYLWIGLKNVALKGFSFEYMDGSPLRDTYHPWLPGNPDNEDGDEKCVSMYPEGDDYSGQWNDYDCVERLAYCCSKPGGSTS